MSSQLPSFAGVRIESATLRRSGATVFDALSLSLTEARIGLIGDNGAGKSSLFRMICGLDRPQRGSVGAHGLASGSTRTVGMMFQNPDDQIVFPTVEEELALGLTAQGLRRAQALERARAFLQEYRLGDWAGRAVSTLSQGQRQHVCWMSLRLAGHRVLLLDEPYASLDLPGQARLRGEIDAAGPQVQIIVSTHALEHVRDFERVIWLDAGRLRADGPGRTVCAAYAADVRARLGKASAPALDCETVA
jgi:biotin transport system ATP-binding protein